MKSTTQKRKRYCEKIRETFMTMKFTAQCGLMKSTVKRDHAQKIS